MEKAFSSVRHARCGAAAVLLLIRDDIGPGSYCNIYYGATRSQYSATASAGRHHSHVISAALLCCSCRCTCSCSNSAPMHVRRRMFASSLTCMFVCYAGSRGDWYHHQQRALCSSRERGVPHRAALRCHLHAGPGSRGGWMRCVLRVKCNMSLRTFNDVAMPQAAS